MERLVNERAAASNGGGAALLALYDVALPQVYGYLVHRCGDPAVAEDLTSETFMAAVTAVQREVSAPQLTVAWLIAVARHKLVDHWRAREREERKLALVGGAEGIDDWDELIEVARAQEVLASLGAHHRVALTLRYLDGLPVRDVAAYLGRTEHATEALLVRARAAFRRTYGEGDDAPEGGTNT
jgi:RNA polymerase sigma-70 factor (ECF subfamily)